MFRSGAADRCQGALDSTDRARSGNKKRELGLPSVPLIFKVLAIPRRRTVRSRETRATLLFLFFPSFFFSPSPTRNISFDYKRAPITQKVQLRGVRFQLGDYGRNKFAWFLRRMELTGEENLPRSSRFFTANRERERERGRALFRLLIGTID